MAAVKVEIAGVATNALIDTGAEGSAISLDFLERYIEADQYLAVDVNSPKGAGEDALECHERIFLPVIVGEVAYMISFFVVRNLCVDVLIGQDIVQDWTIDPSNSKILIPQMGATIDLMRCMISRLKGQEVTHQSSILFIQGVDAHDAWENADESLLIGAITNTNCSSQVLKDLDIELEEVTKKRRKIIAEANIKTCLKDRKLKALQEENEKMRMIMHTNPDLFIKSFEAGTLRVPPVDLVLNRSNPKPVISKLKPLAHSELKIVENWIKEALAKGIIEESNSTW